MPTREKADAAIDQFVARTLRTMDANNTLYSLDASSDYDPGPDLEKIKAPLIAVNSADDLINPPELGILEREITRVKHGKAVVIPLSDQTRGHGTHTLAAVWKNHLAELCENRSTSANNGDANRSIELVPKAGWNGRCPEGVGLRASRILATKANLPSAFWPSNRKT